MNIYASRNAANGIINEGARIICFDSQAAAEAWLLSGHADGLHPRVTVGRFLGHWKRTDPPDCLFPTAVLKTCAPFKLDELDTKGPDDHHVGNHFEHTPTADVLVLVNQPTDNG